MKRIPAIIAAGDGKAAKAVYGQSKAYLEVAGRPLVARVAAQLQRVPEVSEVWVVGNAQRLAQVFADAALRAELVKPLFVAPQFRNLLQNAWFTFLRLLPNAGPAGRAPQTPEEAAQPVLYLSADLPFATAQEISAFIHRASQVDCDYALGLVPESSMQGFAPHGGAPGIRMACFHTMEGRFRQSNLHLVRPARLGNREAVEQMYEHRYQQRPAQMLRLAWRILTYQGGGPRILRIYGLMHLALICERLRLRALSDWLRRAVSFGHIERACSSILQANFRMVVTCGGGCAVDIDNEHDLDVARRMAERWWAEQSARVRERYGELPPVARPAEPLAPVVLPPAPGALGAGLSESQL